MTAKNPTNVGFLFLEENVKIAKKFVIFSVALLFFATACNKNSQNQNFQEFSTQNKKETISEKTKKNLLGKKIALVLGYGYNDEKTVLQIATRIDAEFGVSGPHAISENDENPIEILVFPEDFMKGSKPRVSMLSSVLENEKIAGIITLGAPDGLHSEIAKIKEKIAENDETIFPVVSLFAQDDVLATEEASDFVIDYEHGLESFSPQTLEATEETGQTTHNSIPGFNEEETIIKIIQFEAKNEKKGDKLSEIVKNILDGRKIKPYIDSESKIQSINHFTFE